jgi:adenylosuccinate lyase
MIPRYDKTEISSLWNEHAKFSTYLEVELAILKALEGKKVPAGTAETIRSKATINVERINEIEAQTRHDVIAFCTSITENLDAETGKFFHFGVTSSDIIDSATVVQMKRSLDVILPVFKELLKTLHDRAVEMKDVITMGRSHGMYAEPMSFGQKLLGHYNEFARRYQDLKEFYDNELTIQFSGAVGNYTILTPEDEAKAAENLGLRVEPLSTQVIPRDRIAKMVNIHGLIAGAIERISVEIRHLHRSDVGELHEGFKKGQKGSSTMPHKKNPISGENLTGMARMLRSHQLIAAENIILWHERDISHSSAERMMLPDNFGILFYALQRLKDTVRDLVFHNEKIEARVMEGHNYLSSYYLHYLIENTNFKREDLYYYVQEAAFKGAEAGSAEVFHSTLVGLMEEKGYKLDLPNPTFTEIKKIFTKHVGDVFSRSMALYPLVD